MIEKIKKVNVIEKSKINRKKSDLEKGKKDIKKKPLKLKSKSKKVSSPKTLWVRRKKAS